LSYLSLCLMSYTPLSFSPPWQTRWTARFTTQYLDAPTLGHMLIGGSFLLTTPPHNILHSAATGLVSSSAVFRNVLHLTASSINMTYFIILETALPGRCSTYVTCGFPYLYPLSHLFFFFFLQSSAVQTTGVHFFGNFVWIS